MSDLKILSQSTDEQELKVLEQNYVIETRINNHVDGIITTLKDLTHNFFKLGYHLSFLRENWSDDLKKSDFYSFCEEKFLLKPTSIKNLINVYTKFKNPDDPEQLDERFEGFSFSALVELLPISDDKEFVKNFKKLSTREIREVVAVYRDGECSEDILTRITEGGFHLLGLALEKLGCNFQRNYETSHLSFDVSLKDSDIIKNFRFYCCQKTFSDSSIYFYAYGDYLRGYMNFSDNYPLENIDQLAIWVRDYLVFATTIDEVEEIDEGEYEEPICETGLANKLGLKESEICDYLTDKEKILERFERIESLFSLGIHVYRFNDLQEILLLEITNKETGNIEDSEFIIVGANLQELYEYDVRRLMTK